MLMIIKFKERLYDKISLIKERNCYNSDISSLFEHGIFSVRFLSKVSRKDLYTLNGISGAKIEKIYKLVKKVIPLGFTTLYKILKRHSTFCIGLLNKNINNVLKGLSIGKIGGIETKEITEIFGESKSGKTQFCHIISVSILISDYEDFVQKKVIYIDTDGSFKPERIIEISKYYGVNRNSLTKNIFYAKAFHSEHQMQLLISAASITTYANVKLIIVDSCTTLFRTDFTGRGELFQRQVLLGKFLRNLKRLSEEFNLAILVTNQIVCSNLDNFLLGNNIKAIGGNIMAHMTDTKLMLKKCSNEIKTLKVISSIKCPENIIKFRITQKGFDTSLK
uniref:DNA repair protein Rad51 n=1 Tax=Lotharella vacuolata TaxID=74820 RepID=A0A0H5BGX0_9EUKA|nr:DNA repair protein Rad51 [Lotharella vacuolata]